MSAGVSPASATAAVTASAASCSSLRPECFENSVWPIPTIAVSSVQRASCPGRPAGRNWGSADAVHRFDAQHARRPCRCAPRQRRLPGGSRRSGRRRRARPGPRSRLGVGLRGVVREDPRVHVAVSARLLRVPFDRAALAAHRRRWVTQHSAGRAIAGTRAVPSAIASQKNWSSRVGEGGITPGTFMPASRGWCRRRRARRSVRRRTRAPGGSSGCPGRARAAAPARRRVSPTGRRGGP